jgi:Protein of unknown function (DUF4240)
MTIDDFWNLIERIDRSILRRGEGHDEAAIAPLVDTLSIASKPVLQSFQEHLAQALHDIDGREYARAAGQAGRSDDAFLYVRCFVVAMGRDVYEQTRSDPQLMPKTADSWCEPLLYAAAYAWEKATGESLHFDTKVSFETGSNRSLW